MTGKRRYRANRFAANRFAAFKWRGVSSRFPDFMHGLLVVYARLSGEITISVEMLGEIKSDNILRGKVDTNP